MWTPVYFIRLVPLPATVDGVSLPNDDGTFDIYLNANHSEAHRQESLQHEISHITQDHFYQDTKGIEQLEAEANRNTSEPVRIPNIFHDAPPNTIPLFPSLAAFRDYVITMRDQAQNNMRRQSAG